jgi:arginase
MLFKNVLLSPFRQGQRKLGVETGAYHLYEALNLSKSSIIASHSPITSIGSSTEIIDTTSEKWKVDYTRLYNVAKSLDNYILLGGDHTVGQPSVLASLTKVKKSSDLLVIWIDAHADMNTYESSLTKNFHGMPMAGILDLEPAWVNCHQILPHENLLYFGIRDLDEYEREKIEELEIFNTNEIDVLKKEIETKIELNNDIKIHISWDVDSLDPKYLDSTGTTADGGLCPDDIIELFNFVGKRVIALDIVEYNPLLGDDKKSLATMRHIIQSIRSIKKM